jgi:hypothetical protein
MKSRRRIGSPRRHTLGFDYSKDSYAAKQGSGVSLRSGNPKPLMSALGHKRTFSEVCAMSALPRKRTSLSPGQGRLGKPAKLAQGDEPGARFPVDTQQDERIV